MSVNVSGSSTVTRLVQPLNALLATVFTGFPSMVAGIVSHLGSPV